ncbi:glutamine--fructose-6-phosphate transaminase (isomerizing) [Oscillospiraceae bacterium HV4-5-C5C]|nr:glutamine--fructose-6-phosphate transaminase (isomerizing) [Oscillospiraceae bacterium HV4-5-C5C]
MCGVMGYAGPEQAAPILLDGLRKLEYRGYDSAGMAVLNDGSIEVKKCRGRLQLLSNLTHDGQDMPGHIGIGHTRWATHGEPSDENSHPHLSNSGRFAIVHNGIIENYQALKDKLISRGYTFHSETDTEVIANMIEYYDQGDLVQTLIKVLHRLEGSYALGVLSVAEPDHFVAVRKDSPLIVGRGEGENFIASDIPAVLNRTRDVYLMGDNEIAVVAADGVRFFNMDAEEVEKDIYHVEWDVSAAEKGGYEHFMMKEIMEQPKALRDTIKPRIKNGRFVLDDLKFDADWLNSLGRIYIVGCGSAYHAGRIGKDLIEKMLSIPVEVDIASEFRYRNPLLGPDQLVIIISQSGETADTLAALREAKKHGARTLGIVNVVGSSIAREADYVLYTWAGPEIAVATTKAYTCQIAALEILTAYLGQETGRLSDDQLQRLQADLLSLPVLLKDQLERPEDVQYLASQFFNCKDIFFIGRALDYSLTLEGSLKLKEISYIHSEASAAGELKHGTISLIQKGTLVIALVTQPRLREKMISNIREVKARGAVVLAVALEDDSAIADTADYVIRIPHVSPDLEPIAGIIPLQLFAYYVAALNGNDVDKPRNLAKSVTVE